MDVIEDEKLCDRANSIGEFLRKSLAGIRDRNHLRCIGDIRGLGAMVAMELVKDGDASQPDAALTKALVQAAARRGLIILSCGVRSNVIRLLVPLTAPETIVKEGLTLLEQALLEVVQA
jgi:4-aminobutyrate aminotransferase-like enzyme